MYEPAVASLLMRGEIKCSDYTVFVLFFMHTRDEKSSSHRYDVGKSNGILMVKLCLGSFNLLRFSHLSVEG